jgi:Kef-type K+ transport system membrane component KefB
VERPYGAKFLAGAEVDPDGFRERFGAPVGIGPVSFIGLLVVPALVAYGLLDWSVKASLIASTACPTPGFPCSSRSRSR